MGKVTGFMEYERIEEGYKPVAERLKHYKEFVIGLDDEQAKVRARAAWTAAPVLQQRLPGQQHHSGLQRPGVPRRLEAGHRGAAQTNNFPEFTGRICPAPCEAACTLNINDDAGGHQVDRARHHRPRLGEGWVVPQPPRQRPARRWPWSAPARPAWPRPSSWRAPATT
jgi:glutamate synthase (NADPH/NADH) small chain